MWTHPGHLGCCHIMTTNRLPIHKHTHNSVGNGCHKQPPMARWPTQWHCHHGCVATTTNASSGQCLPNVGCPSTYLTAEFHRLPLGARDGELMPQVPIIWDAYGAFLQWLIIPIINFLISQSPLLQVFLERLLMPRNGRINRKKLNTSSLRVQTQMCLNLNLLIFQRW